MNNPISDDQYTELKSRVERLEATVFRQAHVSDASPRKFGLKGGPTAGILTLAGTGYFDAPNRRSLRDVRTALLEQGKDYSPQAVNIALQRLSKGKKAVLVRHKDGSSNSYVIRA